MKMIVEICQISIIDSLYSIMIPTDGTISMILPLNSLLKYKDVGWTLDVENQASSFE